MRTNILNTEAFKNLSAIQRKIYSGRKQITEINDHHVIAKYKGREAWLKEFNPSTVHRGIVLELLDNDNVGEKQ